MADPMIAEIKMWGCNFEPRGWLFCNGQLLQIAQNTALFSLLGTTYGGDGRSTFGLPELRNRAAMHEGSGPGLSPRTLGEKLGNATEFLAITQMPAHNHTPISLNADGNTASPANATWAIPSADRDLKLYDNSSPTIALNNGAISNSGSGQAHNNLMPYQGVNFCIATTGLYPSRN